MAANPTCYVRYLHAVPDASALDVYVNGYPVQKGVGYKDFTKYFTAFPGIYNLKVFASGSTADALLDQNMELDAGKIYTIAMEGMPHSMSCELFPDNNIRPRPGSARIRYINLSPSGNAFDITMNERPAVDKLGYCDYTDYNELSPGNYYFRAFDADTNEQKLSSPKMLLKAGKCYACYIVGLDGKAPGLQILVPLEGSTYL